MAEEGSSASDVCEVRSLSRFVAGFLRLEIEGVTHTGMYRARQHGLALQASGGLRRHALLNLDWVVRCRPKSHQKSCYSCRFGLRFVATCDFAARFYSIQQP